MTMRSIDEYMALPYKMEIVRDEAKGGHVVTAPDLPGCVTFAETAEEALKLAEDAKREWFAAALEDGYDIPEPSRDDAYSADLTGLQRRTRPVSDEASQRMSNEGENIGPSGGDTIIPQT